MRLPGFAAPMILLASAAAGQTMGGSSTPQVSAPSTAPAAARVGQPPMNSAMRQAQSGTPMGSSIPQSGMESSTNAMTLTLLSAGANSAGPSPRGPAQGASPANETRYDASGIRDQGTQGDVPQTGGSQQNSPQQSN